MKLNSKVLLAVVTVAASGFGFATSAFAQSAGSVGVGGVAGSASFKMTGTAVDSAAVSAAVGKDTAYAGANANGAKLDAFAVGTGGEITTTDGTVNATSGLVGNNYIYKVGADAKRDVLQTNVLGGSVDINATTGLTSGTGSTTVRK